MEKSSSADTKIIVVVPSGLSVASRGTTTEGTETEIAAHVSIPRDGGWGWVVVASAFTNVCILDGIVFTFGSLLVDMANDLNQPQPMIALVNSIAVAVYFIAGPLVSALINRFGFRACTMSGSVISSASFCCTYYSESLLGLCLFYGVLAGMGFSMINMSSNLVVGFYFERYRATAMAITTMGSGAGVLTFSRLNTYLVSMGGWRLATLLHSGLLGLIFFIAMTYRPLVSVRVVMAGDPTRTVTFLPNTSKHGRVPSESGTAVAIPTVAERIFGAVSNANYPTSAAVVEESVVSATSLAGPSKIPEPNALTLTTYNPERRQNRYSGYNMKPSTSRASKDFNRPKRSWWARLCHWEPHVRQERPMYRDDAFYHGSVAKLLEYERSTLGTDERKRSGLEYQLAVSRAAATVDLHEKPGLCTTAVRRVLATMLDPSLLHRPSYLMLCLSGCSTFMGLLVPYVYLQERNTIMGMPSEHTTMLISAVGLANMTGRLLLGLLANKLEPTTLTWVTQLIAGVATTLSHISYTIYYQYLYCGLFGFCIASVACLKSVMIVSLYGLDKLTNGTGIILMFQGIGSLFSTPLSGIIMLHFGYTASFVVAGSFIILSCIFMMPIRTLVRRENIKLSNI